jgi:hypothetical protein
VILRLSDDSGPAKRYVSDEPAYFIDFRITQGLNSAIQTVAAMDKALANALKRKEELERELAEIERFLELHQRYSETEVEHSETPLTDEDNRIWEAVKVHTARRQQAEAFRKPSVPKRRGAPANFKEIAARVLRDVGRPLQRMDLVAEIERRGVEIPSMDKARYIGTILWRNQDVFENFEGVGYWLRGTPLPDPDQYSLVGKILS